LKKTIRNLIQAVEQEEFEAERINYESKRDEMRTSERYACRSVLDSYNETRATTGSSGAIDYSRITGGRGAQYSDSGKNLPLLDFVVDVENTLSETLHPNEITLFLKTLLETDRLVTTEQMQRIEERVGRQFKLRGLYPVFQYFTTVKKALPRDRV
jgi:hypothetical protein